MNEITFWAWDKVSKSFVSFTVKLGEETFLDPTRFAKALYLSTGRKDKNGKGIYDGHVLKYKRDKGLYLIHWLNDGDDCGFVCDRQKPDYNYMLPVVWGEMRIVGHIQENPELLQQIGYATQDAEHKVD